MPPSRAKAEKKYYTVEQANKALPLVRAIVTDIVRQYQVVEELQERLSGVTRNRRRASDQDPYYSEELAHTQEGLEVEETRLREYIGELRKLGVELKGPDGLCDFYSLMEGREVFLCWKLGEPEVLFWHEINAGFPGRQPLTAGAEASLREGLDLDEGS